MKQEVFEYLKIQFPHGGGEIQAGKQDKYVTAATLKMALNILLNNGYFIQQVIVSDAIIIVTI